MSLSRSYESPKQTYEFVKLTPEIYYTLPNNLQISIDNIDYGWAFKRNPKELYLVYTNERLHTIWPRQQYLEELKRINTRKVLVEKYRDVVDRYINYLKKQNE